MYTWFGHMRHPLLRILVALIVGLWSPMCCCQAAMFIGGACPSCPRPETPAPEPEPECCCCKHAPTPAPGSSCGDSPTQADSSPHQPDSKHPCNSCPACKGSAATTASASAAISFHLPALQFDLFATLLLANFDCPVFSPQLDRPTAQWSPRGCIPRESRDVLRRHCALIV